MLIGQGVPHAKPHKPTKAEASFWREKLDEFGKIAAAGFTVAECLAKIRSGEVKLA